MFMCLASTECPFKTPGASTCCGSVCEEKGAHVCSVVAENFHCADKVVTFSLWQREVLVSIFWDQLRGMLTPCAVPHCFRTLKTDGGVLLRYCSSYFCVRVICTTDTFESGIYLGWVATELHSISEINRNQRQSHSVGFQKFCKLLRLRLQWSNSLQTSILKDDVAASIECAGRPFCLVQCEIRSTSCVGE